MTSGAQVETFIETGQKDTSMPMSPPPSNKLHENGSTNENHCNGYECNKCGKHFTHYSNLSIHRKIHLSEPYFKCEVCHKQFVRSGDKTKHMRVHSGERPYECLVCGRRFSQNSNMRKHWKIMHNATDDDINNELLNKKLGHFIIDNPSFVQNSNHIESSLNDDSISKDTINVFYTDKQLAPLDNHVKREDTSDAVDVETRKEDDESSDHRESPSTVKPNKTLSNVVNEIVNNQNYSVVNYSKEVNNEKENFVVVEQNERINENGLFETVIDIKHENLAEMSEVIEPAENEPQSFAALDNRSEQYALANPKILSDGTKCFTCSVCGKQFIRGCDWKKHMRVHSGEKPFQCPDCGKRFSQSSNMKKHHKMHGNRFKSYNPEKKNYLTKGNPSFKTFSSPVSESNKVETSMFSDSYCDPTVSSETNTIPRTPNDVEKIGTNDDKTFTCEICGRGFIRQADLVKHSRVHSGERPYECPKCGKRFSQNSNMRKHCKIMHGFVSTYMRKRYKIENYEKFSSPSFMQRLEVNTVPHETSDSSETTVEPLQSGSDVVDGNDDIHVLPSNVPHSNYDDKSLVSDNHQQSFEYQSKVIDENNSSRILSDKILIHTNSSTNPEHKENFTCIPGPRNDKHFQCNLCKKVCTSSSDIKKHMRVHSGEKPYECMECGRRFSQNSNVRKHWKIMHGSLKQLRIIKHDASETVKFMKASERDYDRLNSFKGNVQGSAEIFEKNYSLGNRECLPIYKNNRIDDTIENSSEMDKDSNHLIFTNLDDEHSQDSEISEPTLKPDLSIQDSTHFQRPSVLRSPYSEYPTKIPRPLSDSLQKCIKVVDNGENKLFVCTLCNKEFTRGGDIKKHMRVHSGERPFACMECGKRFSQSSNMRKHCRMMHRKWDAYKFHDSDSHYIDHKEHFIEPYSTKYHYQNKDTINGCSSNSSLVNNRELEEACSSTNTIIVEPVEIKEEIDDQAPSMDNSTSESSVYANGYAHTDEYSDRMECESNNDDPVHHKPYQCSICGKRFSQNSTMMKHRRMHGILNKYKHYKHLLQPKYFDVSHSSQTSKGLKVSSNSAFSVLSTENREYERSLHKDSDYTPEDKNIRKEKDTESHFYVEEDRDRLNISEYSNGDVRDIRENSPKLFTLKRHTFASDDFVAKNRIVRIENGVKCFSCKICGKDFIRSGDLSKHIRVHSGEKPYQCHLCYKRFSQNSNMRKHMKIMHGEEIERFWLERNNHDHNKDEIRNNAYEMYGEKNSFNPTQVSGYQYNAPSSDVSSRMQEENDSSKRHEYSFVREPSLTDSLNQESAYQSDRNDEGTAESDRNGHNMSPIYHASYITDSSAKHDHGDDAAPRGNYEQTSPDSFRSRESASFTNVIVKQEEINDDEQSSENQQHKKESPPPERRHEKFLAIVGREALSHHIETSEFHSKSLYESKNDSPSLKKYSEPKESPEKPKESKPTKKPPDSFVRSNGEVVFVCEVCGKEFIRNADRTKHMRVHSGERPYECPICNKRFTQNSNMWKHFRAHQTKGDPNADKKKEQQSYPISTSILQSPNTSRQSPTKTVIVSPSGRSVLISPHGDPIDKRISDHVRLSEHIDQQIIKMESPVENTHDYLSDKEYIMNGQNIAGSSDSEKPLFIKKDYSFVEQLKCDICFKEFTCSSNFKIHMRVHSGEKPYACPECGKRFSQSGNMHKHRRKHSTNNAVESGFRNPEYSFVRVDSNDKSFYSPIIPLDFAKESHENILNFKMIKSEGHRTKETYSYETTANEYKSVVHDAVPHSSTSLSPNRESPVKPLDVEISSYKPESPPFERKFHPTYSYPTHTTDSYPSMATTLSSDLKTSSERISYSKYNTSDNSSSSTISMSTKDKHFGHKNSYGNGNKSNSASVKKESVVNNGNLSCPVCNKVFTRSGDLKKHSRVHSGEKPYTCDLCGKAFSQSSNMRKHRKLMHPPTDIETNIRYSLSDSMLPPIDATDTHSSETNDRYSVGDSNLRPPTDVMDVHVRKANDRYSVNDRNLHPPTDATDIHSCEINKRYSSGDRSTHTLNDATDTYIRENNDRYSLSDRNMHPPTDATDIHPRENDDRYSLSDRGMHPSTDATDINSRETNDRYSLSDRNLRPSTDAINIHSREINDRYSVNNSSQYSVSYT